MFCYRGARAAPLSSQRLPKPGQRISANKKSHRSRAFAVLPSGCKPEATDFGPLSFTVHRAWMSLMPEQTIISSGRVKGPPGDSRCECFRQQSGAGAHEERGSDALIDAHPTGDEILGFAQRLQEKAAQSIPGQDAQPVISGRERFGPEPYEPHATEEQPSHFQKLHRDAAPAHAPNVVEA